MTQDYIIPKGDRIQPEQLRALKARSLASALINCSIEFASFVDCYKYESTDTVVFDVDAEVPQLRTNPIKGRERLEAVFTLLDDKAPEVLSLRPDFPRVPHLNLNAEEFPRSLCLYEELYRDLKSRWTAQRFIERVRQWLSLTAKGQLHGEDQPLEPLLSGYAGVIVLPPDILKSGAQVSNRLYLLATEIGTRFFFISYTEKPQGSSSMACVASVHVCPARQHGVIRRSPRTVADISQFAQESGLDLIAELRNRLKEWWRESSKDFNFMEGHLIIILVCPKTRRENGAPEETDVWAFITGDKLKEVGKKIGLWGQQNGLIVPLIPADVSKTGADIQTDLLNPSFQLTRGKAAFLSGLLEIYNPLITAIGVGALGSQVIMNLARSGLGTWRLIDHDTMMPHNVTRHALGSEAVGFKKADVVAFLANNLIHGENLFSHIVADVMAPQPFEREVADALTTSDVILDLSASVTVARYLSLNVESQARRISLYLNPSGDDLVLLAEDSARMVRLDELEMQFYRALIHNTGIQNHYGVTHGRRRYGQSCRDITSILSQNVVALHAALGARELQNVCRSNKSQISIWRSDPTGNVKRLDFEVYPTYRNSRGEWRICSDEYLLAKLRSLRNDKQPNETGGVLIGSFDLERKIIYIVDTLPSPPDSEEWPTLYIRGSQGLKQNVDELSKKTAGMLEYIGEWHSHPGSSTAPSGDDIQVFSWLTSWMDRDGLPAVMMIVGQGDRVSCFVGQINREENLFQIGR